MLEHQKHKLTSNFKAIIPERDDKGHMTDVVNVYYEIYYKGMDLPTAMLKLVDDLLISRRQWMEHNK